MGDLLDRHWIESRFPRRVGRPDAGELDPGPLRPAAVLVPLVERYHGINVVLTRRAENLRDHPGQISFPGGRIDAGDSGPLDAALRETEEEIGVARPLVEVLGPLPRYRTGTGFLVHPLVGFVDPRAGFRPEPGEVSEIFEVPLEFVLDTRNHRPHIMHREGRRIRLHAIPFRDYYIWGATAGMLRVFGEVLLGTMTPPAARTNQGGRS